MADKPWLDPVFVVLQFRFGLGSGAYIYGACHRWRAPNLMGGKGFYCLDAGISSECQIRFAPVEFCT